MYGVKESDRADTGGFIIQVTGGPQDERCYAAVREQLMDYSASGPHNDWSAAHK